jgi:hypothetical protein
VPIVRRDASLVMTSNTHRLKTLKLKSTVLKTSGIMYLFAVRDVMDTILKIVMWLKIQSAFEAAISAFKKADTIAFTSTITNEEALILQR